MTATHHARAAILSLAVLTALAGSSEAQTPPQPTLPKVVLTIGKTRVNAEIADDPKEKEVGLMGRKELAEGDGMLFVFAHPQRLDFWMKDTLVPLSIAYINAQGIIREIHDMKPLDTNTTDSIFEDLVYALEVPQGWFAKSGILTGDRVMGLPKPSTSD